MTIGDGNYHGPYHHVTQSEKEMCPICDKQYQERAVDAPTLKVTVDARRLLAIRDALVADDVFEAYHQLVMAVDPTFDFAKGYRDHFAHLVR